MLAYVVLAVKSFEKPSIQSLNTECQRRQGQKLGTYRKGKPLDFSPALRNLRAVVQQRHPKARAGVLERRRAKRRAVINVELSRKTTPGKGLEEAIAVTVEVLG